MLGEIPTEPDISPPLSSPLTVQAVWHLPARAGSPMTLLEQISPSPNAAESTAVLFRYRVSICWYLTAASL
jgi:hypothetical protein